MCGRYEPGKKGKKKKVSLFFQSPYIHAYRQQHPTHTCPHHVQHIGSIFPQGIYRNEVTYRHTYQSTSFIH